MESFRLREQDLYKAQSINKKNGNGHQIVMMTRKLGYKCSIPHCDRLFNEKQRQNQTIPEEENNIATWPLQTFSYIQWLRRVQEVFPGFDVVEGKGESQNGDLLFRNGCYGICLKHLKKRPQQFGSRNFAVGWDMAGPVIGLLEDHKDEIIDKGWYKDDNGQKSVEQLPLTNYRLLSRFLLDENTEMIFV